MESWGNRAELHQDIVSYLADNQNGDGTLLPPTLPDSQLKWLAQLSLLYGIPVEYMIPNIDMLPTESLRFFFLDRNWLDRLTDGAMSVGVLSTQDAIFNKAFFKQIYQQIDEAQIKLRSQLRNADAPTTDPGGPITGLILRSQVVADFPGMEIEPTKDGQTLPILRMDTLSSTTLICLIGGVPDKVEFIQPSEGLQLGIFPKNPPSSGEDFHLLLRGLGAGGYEAGSQIEDGSGVKLKANGAFRSGADQPSKVVNIGDLVSNIEQTLGSAALPGTDHKLTPGGLAIQLTKTSQNQPYQNGVQFNTCLNNPSKTLNPDLPEN